MKNVKISASILSADFRNLKSGIKTIDKYVDEYHLDIMDGHFVPNISFGPEVVKAVRKITKKPLDVHLMVEYPMKYIDMFVDAGADMITFHYETVNFFDCKNYIRNRNVKVGVAYNPNTPVYILDSDIDRVLIMSVYPGSAGQKFISSTLKKISETKDYIDERNYDIEIAVDGGIKTGSAHDVVKLGADVIVAGSSIFKGSIKKNVIGLRKDAEKGYDKRKEIHNS